MNKQNDALIKNHGGYRNLVTFQLSRLIYDLTVRFCDKFIGKRSRTHDQMVQAARSGVQNIAEGSQNSGTSKKSELKLTNVARGSLEELYCDYEDFLRHYKLETWESRCALRTELVDRRFKTANEVAYWVQDVHKRTGEPIPQVAANTMLILIKVACSLLKRQIHSQAEAFKTEGGFTERLYRVRKASR